MRKFLFTIITTTCFSILVFAQPPQSFKYQSVLRDASGQVLANQEVAIGVAILQGSISGAEAFSETHNTATNNFGLVNLDIGSVDPIAFAAIDWPNGPYFIQITVDGTIMGTSQLLSVPYALHANTASNVDDADADPANELQDISLQNNQLSISQGSTVNLTPLLSAIDTSNTNELQDINLSGNQLSISKGSAVDLSDVGTDSQLLSLHSNWNLKISGGNTITLPYLVSEQDSDPENELQNISRAGLTVTLDQNGGAFQDSVLVQTISRSGLAVTLSDNGGTFQDSVLTEANVDAMVSNNGYQLIADDEDTDDTNELQNISRVGLTVTLDKNGGAFQDSILTETDVDVMVNNNGYQFIADDGDIDDTNELQNISRVGLTVTLDKNGGAFQDSILTETDVDAMVNNNGYQFIADDGDTDDTNELQNISRAGLTVTLDQNGGTYQDSILAQTISRSGLAVTLSNNGGTYQDSILTEADVDAMVGNNGYQLESTDMDIDSTNELQVLSISNDTIFLSNDGFVKLPAESDPLYNNSIAKSITSTDTSNWNNKLDSCSEADPIFDVSPARDITNEDVSYIDHLQETNSIEIGLNAGISHPDGVDGNFPSNTIEIGSYARSYSVDSNEAGIAIGPMTTARYPRPGNPNSGESIHTLTSIAIGGRADGDYGGIAIGHEANGQYYNIAIGANASAYSGYGRIAIGNDLVNRYNHSIVLRGTLFLDNCAERTINGQTGRIFYRTTAPDLEVDSIGSTSGWVAKAFTIDHPLDPENKVLRHFCIEGPEVWNVYAGNAQIVSGQAVVKLPDYYEALNKVGSEIYSLTAVGGFADCCILEPCDGKIMVIGATRDITVSWTIKVLRNDEALKKDLEKRPVEQLKSELSRLQIRNENKSVNTF